ncbi:MAG: hypothetical protein ACE5HZ_09365 [Fidelibacterota bacterium]
MGTVSDRVRRRLGRLPAIGDKGLYRAVSKAVYLIVEHSFSLKKAVESASTLYPTKSHIEKHVRQCFSPTWFEKRAKRKFLSRMSEGAREQYIEAAMTEDQLDRQFRESVSLPKGGKPLPVPESVRSSAIGKRRDKKKKTERSAVA